MALWAQSKLEESVDFPKIKDLCQGTLVDDK